MYIVSIFKALSSTLIYHCILYLLGTR